MSKIKLSLVLFVLILTAISNNGWAQAPQNINFPLDPMYRKVFDQDSLKGFDEQAARASALSEGFFGSEFTVRLYNFKREYIDNKYRLRANIPPHPTIEEYLAANRPAAVPGCVNEDFEASAAAVITTSNQVLGWTVTHGYNSTPGAAQAPYYPNWSGGTINSCNLITCCPMPPSVSEILDCSAPGGYIDADIGSQYPIYSVFGAGPPNAAAAAANPQLTNTMSGNKIIRINDGIANYSIEKLSKTFSITSQNCLFQFAFISVFATGHPCCDAGAFSIKLPGIPCPSFSVSAPGPGCLAGAGTPSYYVAGSGITYTYNTSTSNASFIYNQWQISSMDLSAYIGQNITIDIIASDCTGGAHYGKIFFDAQCGPMTVIGNGTAYDAGTTITVPTCGAAGATLCAASGLGPYSWAGNGVPIGYTAPSMTNQCFVTNVSAQYTLYMQPAGSCAPIQRIVNSTVTPAPLLNASAVQAVCGSTLATITATPSGSAANPSTISWSPTPLSLSSGTTVGTYSIPIGQTPMLVTIVASDPLGCLVTTTLNVNPAPPIPTFTIVNATNSSSITCDYPVINLNANTTYSYNGGSLNYFWASNSTTFATSGVSIVNPGTYTVNGSDPVTNCVTTRTVSIGVNTVVPVSTIGPLLQSITCGTAGVTAQNVTVTANPTVNITHQILSPYGGTFVSTSYIDHYTPGGIGTFTYCLKNDVNGCSVCKNFTVTSSQGFPTFTVMSPNNFTLGCTTTSCAALNIVGGATSTLTPGGAVSYTILAPGSSSATPPGSLSTVAFYTVCTPGSYTVITKDNVNFCETRVPISVLQNTFAPTISAQVDRTTLDCYNPKVTLRGLSMNSNIFYTWIFVATPNSLQGDTVTAFINASSPTQTLVNTYTLVITDSSSTCKSQMVIPIYQNLFVPKAGVSPSITSVSCNTQSVTLSNLSSTGILTVTGYPHNLPVVGALWEGPTPQQPQTNVSTYVASTPGIYTMTAQDLNNGCTAKATMTVLDNVVYPDINADLNSFTVTLDCGSTTTVLSAQTTSLNPQPTYSYHWDTDGSQIVSGAETKSLTTQTPGSYAVFVKNLSSGCSTSANYAVVPGSLTADFAPDQLTGFAPLTVTFKNNSTSTNGSDKISSVWNYGNGTSSGSLTTAGVFVSGPISASISPSILYNQPGTYTISLYSTKGVCMASAQKVIKLDIPSVLEVPNVFTPNGDGINDLYFMKVANLSEITAVIFDRWGHKVYELTSETGNIEWDGKNLYGKDAAEGVYFYTIKATGKDGKPYDKKGTISLFR